MYNVKVSKFPIFFWCGRANANIAGEREKSDWLDAHFTRLLLGVGTTPEEVKKARELLDWCAEHGIDAILGDPRVSLHNYGIYKDHPADAKLPPDYRETVRAAARDYADHPAVYGFNVIDEPGWQARAACAEAAHIVREETGKEPFINQKPH